jgi:hypothetical protein
MISQIVNLNIVSIAFLSLQFLGLMIFLFNVPERNS